jgi:hypothetical protein
MPDTIQCRGCGGMGFVMKPKLVMGPDGKPRTEMTHERCPNCGGSGSVPG